MKKSKLFVTKKKMGRPAIGVGTQIGMRWREHELAAIDAWRRAQPELPSRTDAIRRLCDLAIKAKLK